ncbi:PKD domain-containing protein [Pelagicoccus mobilis]|uniref:PKD domain-containing protein n=1 Tax=Pelagicoccus mobilis TaxID=415221 RepID=A0A934RX72_9BACT|nr:PKD domain-containing protein [Pelagicoccus mobilis]MBK1877125.1 PKD domain-containing protein [Pelagicoccus mobilis]
MKTSTSKALAVSLALICAALLTFFLRDAGPQASKSASQEKPPAEHVSELSQQIADTLQNVETTSSTAANTSLVELAQERRLAMKELMETQPQTALQLAFSLREYEQLPSEVQAIVERPFSELAHLDVIAVCYEHHDHHHSHFKYSLKTEDGQRHQVPPMPQNRLSMSKENVPVQGIELDGIAIVRQQIFQRLEGEELDWALQSLPLANSAPQTDFFTNESLAESSIHAISGGYLFRFANEENLSLFEQKLANLDSRPGLDIGSPALLASLRKEAAPFSEGTFFSDQEASVGPPPDELRPYLIIRVDFSDKNGTPFEKQPLEDLIDNQVAPTFARYSYNKTSVDVTVTDSVYRLGATTDYGTPESQNTDKLYDDAVTAYIADGNADPATVYDHVSISFPDLEFGWAGLATVGGRRQWLQDTPPPSTIVHELGHNYGLNHASYWNHTASNPNSTNPVDPSGANIEYGDPFDVMGDGEIEAGHFHMAAKQRLGWIDNSQWSDLTSSNDSNTYRIYAFDNVSATGLQALRVNKSGGNEHYWVGFREGYPGLANFDRGAYLIWQRPGSSNNRSWLVDTTPLSADGKNDSGIAIGRTYSDTDAGVHITPLAKGQNATGSYLDIAVNIGDFSGNQAPSGTLTASTEGVARNGIPFSFDGSDPDSDPLSYHWDFGDGTVEVNSASIEHEFPVGGSYTLTLTVSDQKGGTSVHQANVEISDPITELATRTSDTLFNLTALAANESVVVVGGDRGTYLRSTDGETWTSHGLNPNFFPNHRTNQIIWTGGSFIAVGSDSLGPGNPRLGIAFSSDDGMTWTEELRTTESVGDFGFLSIAEDPNTNTSVIVQSNAKLLRRDSEGNFTVIDLGLTDGAWGSAASVVWTGTHFVVGGYDFFESNPDNNGDTSKALIIFRSTDGTNWTRVDAAESGLLGWYGLRDLDFLNGKLMGSGFFSGIVYSADSGETWTNNSPTSTRLASMFAYGNGIYSAHGTTDNTTNQDFLSTDARNWQPAGDPGSSFNDRIFFANTFISVGNNGLIQQSQEFFAPVVSAFEAWIVGFTTNQSDQGALGNPDFDWAPNFIEYALGSDPTDSDSVPTPPSLEFQEDGKIVVSISRLAKTDVELSLESSVNLEVWDPLPTETTDDTETLLELTTTQSFDANEAIFIRVKATQ